MAPCDTGDFQTAGYTFSYMSAITYVIAFQLLIKPLTPGRHALKLKIARFVTWLLTVLWLLLAIATFGLSNSASACDGPGLTVRPPVPNKLIDCLSVVEPTFGRLFPAIMGASMAIAGVLGCAGVWLLRHYHVRYAIVEPDLDNVDPSLAPQSSSEQEFGGPAEPFKEHRLPQVDPDEEVGGSAHPARLQHHHSVFPHGHIA
eukprot:m.53910 g.53910  ORF g.53910 m.53910 type:complete len:202 (+) comp48665_c0_seq1:56-661(+)